jgi:hypothetical protein
MGWAGHVLCRREMINVYNILVGKHEGNTPLGRHGYRCEDNI